MLKDAYIHKAITSSSPVDYSSWWISSFTADSTELDYLDWIIREL